MLVQIEDFTQGFPTLLDIKTSFSDDKNTWTPVLLWQLFINIC